MDEFVALFGHFYAAGQLFVITPRLRDEGVVQTVVLALKGGVEVLRGDAEVVGALTERQSPYGKAGMQLRFASTDGDGARVLVRLAQESAALAAMPTQTMDVLPADGEDDADALRRVLSQQVASRIMTQKIGAIHVAPRPPSSGGVPDEVAPESSEAVRRLAQLVECEVSDDEPATEELPSRARTEMVEPLPPPPRAAASPLPSLSPATRTRRPSLLVPPRAGWGMLFAIAISSAAAGMIAGYLLAG